MKRVLLVVLLTGIGLIASFVDAFYGLLLYTWYAFSSPLELTYGQLENTRLSLIVGAVVMLTTFHQRRQIVVKHKISLLCLLFVFACFCSLAVQLKFSLGFIVSELELIVKIVLMALLAPLLLPNLGRVRMYIAVVAASAGLLGAYYGVFGLFAGSRSIYGPGRIGDNNGYAVFLTSLLPFIFFSARYLPAVIPSYIRGMISLVLIASNCLAIILTYSRGGFLAGSAVLLLLSTKLKSRTARILGWGLFIPFMTFSVWSILKTDPNLWRVPNGQQSDSVAVRTLDGYLERLATLRRNVETERSASGRLHFWQVALRMVEENPAFGVGLARYPHEYRSYDFSDGMYGEVRAVHNTLLSVLAETGVTGFLLFLAIILQALLSQQRARRQSTLEKQAAEAEEISDYVSMLRISLTGYLLGGMFVTTLYQEIFWVVISISIALERLVAAPQQASEVLETENTAG